MAIDTIIITVSSPDRPGIIQAVSSAILSNSGNWAESSFSILGGVFVGIVRIEIDEQNIAALNSALSALSEQAITINQARYANANGHVATLTGTTTSTQYITLEANDREGIIEELTRVLAHHSVNIINLETRCESASMAGYDLFYADIEVNLPGDFSQQQLQAALEELSEDVMVSLSDSI